MARNYPRSPSATKTKIHVGSPYSTYENEVVFVHARLRRHHPWPKEPRFLLRTSEV